MKDGIKKFLNTGIGYVIGIPTTLLTVAGIVCFMPASILAELGGHGLAITIDWNPKNASNDETKEES